MQKLHIQLMYRVSEIDVNTNFLLFLPRLLIFGEIDISEAQDGLETNTGLGDLKY